MWCALLAFHLVDLFFGSFFALDTFFVFRRFAGLVVRAHLAGEALELITEQHLKPAASKVVSPTQVPEQGETPALADTPAQAPVEPAPPTVATEAVANEAIANEAVATEEVATEAAQVEPPGGELAEGCDAEDGRKHERLETPETSANGGTHNGGEPNGGKPAATHESGQKRSLGDEVEDVASVKVTRSE